MRKKRILFHSNHPILRTGFGTVAANIMRYLFKTGKYELCFASNGLPFEADETKKLPWRCHGTAPSPEEQQQINSIQDHAQREVENRKANYGDRGLDRIVKEFLPDISWHAEDVWGVDFLSSKPWWNKVNPIVHTTLDSLPILSSAIDLAPKAPNYFVWATFAEKAMKDLGYDHVKTLHGPLESENFYKFPEARKRELRQKFGIQDDEEIIGFTFRSQLRKSVPNLLEGFKIFKKENPNIKAKLLLQTSREEGWNIDQLISEYGVDNNDVLNTHFCRKCKEYDIKPWTGNGVKCRFCGEEGSVFTPNITSGVERVQLAEIYNLMTMYCHAFSSGGQECPIQEAKFCELITLVTDYSCGEDGCCEGSGGIPLKWNSYKEGCTQFTKASTCPISIAQEIANVCQMSKENRVAMGKIARDYCLKNYSIEAVGKKIEAILDELPFVDWQDGDFDHQPKNTSYLPPSGLSPEQFAIDILTNMMLERVDHNTSHVKSWASHLRKSNDYQGVYNHFQKLALQFNANLNNKPIDLGDLLDKDDEGRRICIVCDQSAGDLLIINSLLNQFKALYPEYNLYFFTRPEFFDLVEHHPAIHKLLAYSPILDNIFFLEGNGSHKGYFEKVFYPAATTQKFLAYNGNRVKNRTEWLDKQKNPITVCDAEIKCPLTI